MRPFAALLLCSLSVPSAQTQPGASLTGHWLATTDVFGTTLYVPFELTDKDGTSAEYKISEVADRNVRVVLKIRGPPRPHPPARRHCTR